MPPFEIDPAQYSAPYREQEDILIAQEQAHRQSALDYLQQSLASQRDIRPSQGIAAALLAAIPTLGGALLGKAVGQSEVPDGVYGVKLSPTGANAGGMAGAEIGGKAAGDYFGAIEADNLHAQKVNAARAQLEDQNADRLGQQANQYQLRALDTEAKLNLLPVEMRQYQQQLDMQRSSQIAGHIANAEYDRAHEKTFTPQEVEAAKKLGLDLTGSTPQGMNTINNLAAEQRRVDNQNNRIGQTVIPGYANVSNAVPNETTVAKLSEQNFGIQKTRQLIQQYLAAPDAFTGDASAVQGAISGMLVNAQRVATGSGANFTGMEQSLIKQALPIALAGGDVLAWIKAQALGRDQQVFAQALEGLYQKTQDYALAEAYGQIRQDAPPGYYPPKMLEKWGVVDSRIDQMRQRKAELEAKIAAGGQ